MKKIILAFAFVTLSISASLAQSDTSYKTTLKSMLEISGSQQAFKMAITQMMTMFKNQNTSVPENIWADLEKEMTSTSLDELVDMLEPVYKKHMAESDLKKVIEFYQTPVGKKFADKTPLIMQESMQVGQQWGMKIGQKFQEKLKEKGY